MRQTHSPHCISPGSMLQCCSEMWELLQTDTNGDSCPGRGKICIEPRRARAGVSNQTLKIFWRELCAVLQSVCSDRLQSRHCSHSHCRDHCLQSPGLERETHKAAKMWMNSLELIDFCRFSENLRGKSKRKEFKINLILRRWDDDDHKKRNSIFFCFCNLISTFRKYLS